MIKRAIYVPTVQALEYLLGTWYNTSTNKAIFLSVCSSGNVGMLVELNLVVLREKEGSGQDERVGSSSHESDEADGQNEDDQVGPVAVQGHGADEGGQGRKGKVDHWGSAAGDEGSEEKGQGA